MNNNNYGFIFNDIIISDSKFIKKSKNSLGRTKINNEIKFYKYIIRNSIELSIPNLIEYEDGIIILEFIKNSSTLTNVINETNIFDYHKIIKNNLEKLHKNKISVLQEKLYSDLKIEIIDKNLTRFNEYDWYKNNDFKKIKSVKNLNIIEVSFIIL